MFSIDTPFELLKKDINDTFLSLSFDPKGLPVPEQTRVTFCNNLDTSVVDDLGRDLIKIAKIAVVFLVFLALILVGCNCLLTWYRWSCMKRHLEYTRQAWTTDPTIVHSKISAPVPQITLSDHNLMMLRVDSEHPLITRIMNQIAARFHLTPRAHTHTRWFLHYIFHPPALACFLIGFFGLLSVEFQLLAMGPLTAKYQSRAQSTVSDFNDLIATNINASMYNQSAFYASAINTRVDDIQTTINNGVFGWVNGTTTTLNDTINEFYTDVQKAVNLVFGGTILQEPAQEFVKCFIGGKVDAIENAITFLHNNLQVDMPRVNDTVLVLSPASVDEATRPIAAAAVGDGTNGNEGFLGKVIQAYVAKLQKEKEMFGVFMALWAVVVLMGLAIVLWHAVGKPFLEKRKRKNYEKEQRSALENFSSDNEEGTAKDMKISVPSRSKRASFKPFWLNSNSSSKPRPSSENRLADDRPWETAFAKPTLEPVRRDKSRTSKLVAVGRKAFNREPRLKEGEDEEVQGPPHDPESPVDRRGPWYETMTSILSGRKRDDVQESDPVFDEQEQPRPKNRLQIFTQRTTMEGSYDKESEQPGGDLPTRSRFSTSPASTQTSWKHLISPPRKLKQLPPPLPSSITPTVVIIPEPFTPLSPPPRKDTYGSYPHPRIGHPIRKSTSDALDLSSPVSEDPFKASTTVPIPLHTGFSAASTPPSMTKTIHPHLGPPASSLLSQYTRYPTPNRPAKSPERHRKSVSLGGPETPRWRVTNAVPGDHFPMAPSTTVGSSKNGSNAQSYNDVSVAPMTRFFNRADPRNSSLNPFITPFDDEHRVRIDEPTPEGLRKSMQTGPLAY